MSRVSRLVDGDHGSTERVMGIVAPNKGRINEVEFPRVAPDEIAFLINPQRLKEVTPEHVEKALPQLDDAYRALAAAGADMIMVCGMPLIVVPGPGFDGEIIARIEELTGLPGMTMARSVVEGCEALDAREIVVATPYSDEIDAYLADYLEASGLTVIAIDNLGMADYSPDSVNALDPEEPDALARQLLADHPEAEGCFFSSGGMHTLDVIEPLEEEFGVGVVSSGQATIWNGLRILGHEGGIPGFGRLLENHL